MRRVCDSASNDATQCELNGNIWFKDDVSEVGMKYCMNIWFSDDENEILIEIMGYFNSSEVEMKY